MGNLLSNSNDQSKFNNSAYCYKCESPNIKFRIIKYNYCEKCYLKEKTDVYEYEKYNLGFPEIDKITDKVYLGNFDAAKFIKNLKQLGITHILICGFFLPEFFPDDFSYKTIEMEDSSEENIMRYFKESIHFIENSSKTFVHCRAGISRSSSIVIAYIMWSHKKSFSDAKKFVKNKRNCISPNYGFKDQLQDFDAILHEKEYNLDKI
jgi:protein-tyrosine phosphatase